MTILGDRAQTIDAKVQDVMTFLPKLLGRKARKIELNRSYRNTSEITEYAGQIAGITGIEYMKRHGKNVEEIKCTACEDAVECILSRIAPGEGGYETAAVLTLTEREARRVYDAVKAVRNDVSYIDRDSSNFRKGVTVTTFYLAKGLEFDQVFVMGGDRGNPFFTQFRYICATRALHELYVMDYQ